MTLLLLHAEIYYRDCQHCHKWSYDEATGRVRLHRGKPLERDAREKPPCRGRRGCPKGTPENPNTLTRRNMLTYSLYRQCKMTGRWPTDGLFLANARICEDAERVAWEANREVAMREAFRQLR